MKAIALLPALSLSFLFLVQGDFVGSVGTDGNYPTLKAAFDAIKNGADFSLTVYQTSTGNSGIGSISPKVNTDLYSANFNILIL